jgi:exodeoxyribonuclease VII small subunit
VSVAQGAGYDPARFDPALSGAPGPLSSLSFEQLLDALEVVTARLASGELGIEAATDLYEQAEILHAAAEERLAAVEARIDRLRRPGPS